MLRIMIRPCVAARYGHGLIHPTWPSFSPLFLIPIDHCLHNAGIAIKSGRVGKSVGSDHLPVIVEFGLKDKFLGQ